MPIPVEVQRRLPEWKQVHGPVLYIPRTEDAGFVFRAITLAEWRQYKLLLSLNNEAARDEFMGQLLQHCLLWPETFVLDDELSQIEFVQLQQQVEAISPFGSVENFRQTLDQYRTDGQDLSTMVYAFLQIAFPILTHERIGQFTTRELFTHLVIAEQILDKPFPIDLKKGPPPSIPPEDVAGLHAQQKAERRQAALAQARARRAAEIAGASSTPLSSMVKPSKAPHPGAAHSIDFEKEAAAISRILGPDA